jgi:hypothetical protein
MDISSPAHTLGQPLAGCDTESTNGTAVIVVQLVTPPATHELFWARAAMHPNKAKMVTAMVFFI